MTDLAKVLCRNPSQANLTMEDANANKKLA